MGGYQARRGWLSNYVAGKGADWPQIIAVTERGWYPPPFDAYDVDYVPMYLLLDREGRILEVNPPVDDLGRVVERVLSAQGGRLP